MDDSAVVSFCDSVIPSSHRANVWQISAHPLEIAGACSKLPVGSGTFQKNFRKIQKSLEKAQFLHRQIGRRFPIRELLHQLLSLLSFCSLFARCFLQIFLQRFLEFSPAFPDLLCCSRPFGVDSSLDSTASSSFLAHAHHTKHTCTRGKQWAPAATATATVSIPHANRTNSTVPGGISGKDTRSSTN